MMYAGNNLPVTYSQVATQTFLCRTNKRVLVIIICNIKGRLVMVAIQ